MSDRPFASVERREREAAGLIEEYGPEQAVVVALEERDTLKAFIDRQDPLKIWQSRDS